jgi:RimJ/RimL family protein N-acetyltransferase
VLDLIETERLRLSPFSVDDVEAAFRWFGDPEVMQFVPNGPDSSIDATRRRVESYQQHQVTHGFSEWVIRQSGTAEPIGDSGLLVLEEPEGTDLGFRLARPYWGCGFATEAASAWIRVAFLDLDLSRLTAFTHPSNVASLRVLRKVGFTPTGARQVMGMDALTFAYDRSQYGAAAERGEAGQQPDGADERHPGRDGVFSAQMEPRCLSFGRIEVIGSSPLRCRDAGDMSFPPSMSSSCRRYWLRARTR